MKRLEDINTMEPRTSIKAQKTSLAKETAATVVTKMKTWDRQVHSHIPHLNMP